MSPAAASVSGSGGGGVGRCRWGRWRSGRCRRRHQRSNSGAGDGQSRQRPRPNPQAPPRDGAARACHEPIAAGRPVLLGLELADGSHRAARRGAARADGRREPGARARREKSRPTTRITCPDRTVPLETDNTGPATAERATGTSKPTASTATSCDRRSATLQAYKRRAPTHATPSADPRPRLAANGNPKCQGQPCGSGGGEEAARTKERLLCASPDPHPPPPLRPPRTDPLTRTGGGAFRICATWDMQPTGL